MTSRKQGHVPTGCMIYAGSIHKKEVNAWGSGEANKRYARSNTDRPADRNGVREGVRCKACSRSAGHRQPPIKNIQKCMPTRPVVPHLVSV